MASKKSAAEMLRSLYGPVQMQSSFIHVYTQGSCKNTGTASAQGVAGVFWGETSPSNRATAVPGPEAPTNNRSAVFAVLLAVQDADPQRSLMIFSTSEYVIRHACYWAGKNSQIGWACPNGDLLKDLVFLLGK
ncbi:hypothetical protein B0H15DRAFT_792784 [Mycena belliarum]|uniref:RNase H type-1 domain-containing protein n=1 Tax=Mycena belliarum TaxID=1033014 RepID=A0AAD6TRJ8_9AGAR|nr:hypothetical protein B0H15DRAFT_792784 [Mycena belliae]